MLAPLSYTLYRIYLWNMADDSYINRYEISEGFKYVFATIIIVNTILLIIVISTLDSFFKESDEEFQRTGYQYDFRQQPFNYYGGLRQNGQNLGYYSNSFGQPPSYAVPVAGGPIP